MGCRQVGLGATLVVLRSAVILQTDLVIARLPIALDGTVVLVGARALP